MPEPLLATVDEGIKGDEPESADARLPLQRPDSQFEADHHPTNGMCPTTPPQVAESRACIPTLLDDESTSELEPADAEPRLQPQDPSGTASGRGVDRQQRSGSCGLSQHPDHRDNDRTNSPEPHLFAPDDRGESVACSPTLLDDESTGEPEPADAEPSLLPQSPSGTAPRRGVDPQQMSSSGGLSPHPDHYDDDDQASEERHPLTPDDRGEKGSEECPAALPQAQESAAGPPTLPDDEGNNGHELADASPPMHPPAGRDQASGRGRGTRPFRQCRRRRDADEAEDRMYSNAEHSEDDVVQPPPRKRRRGGTCGDSARGAQRSARRPRLQRGTAHPLLSPERDIKVDRTPAATFEEFPFGDAVLKRVTMDGSPSTFMVQFTWDSCAAHGICEEWPLGDAVLKRVTTDGSPPTLMVQFTDPCADPYAEHGAGPCGTENQETTTKRHRLARQKSNGATKCKGKPASTLRRARYTSADDAMILQLRGQGLSWSAIAEQFPGRSAGAIQVRYQTKLKPVKEWEVEEICGRRTLDNGAVELLVKWEGGEETWEPHENMAETKALDEYERLHGPVTVGTV